MNAPVASVLKSGARAVPCFVALGAAFWCQAPAAQTPDARQIAADRGCYNCHSEPSRKSVRSFADIRKSYLALKDRPDAVKQAVERMRHGSMFTHIAAHEALSEQDALLLVRWLFSDEP